MNRRLNFIFLVGALAIGAQAAGVKERLVGAEIAEIGEFPYQVSLRLQNRHFCGGALISKRHVLTAAHCIYSVKRQPWLKNSMSVVAGTNSLTSGGKSYRVAAISHYHKFYDQSKDPDFMYDIAVVTLAEEVTESRFVKLVSLPKKAIKGGEKAIITGWGTTSNPQSPTSRYLRKLDVNVLTNRECQMYYRGFPNIVSSQVCTLKRRGAGVCSGDSGGPLVSNGEVIGVVSGGIACAKGYPDVYTRVQSYLDYIHGILDDKVQR